MIRAYAGNGQHSIPEGAEQSLARSGGHIASARAGFGLISAGGPVKNAEAAAMAAWNIRK